MPSRALTALFVALLGLGVAAADAGAKVYKSKSEALAEAFPDVDRIDTKTHVLDENQVRAVESRARARLETRLVTVHTGIRDGQVVGHAMIDVHTVRTLPEAFLVLISPEGEVKSVRMLAFYEPEEYRPPDRWLGQFEEERLSPKMALGQRIHGIAGSTLSSRAVTGGVRRALAVYQVVLEGEAGSAAAAPARPAASLVGSGPPTARAGGGPSTGTVGTAR